MVPLRKPLPPRIKTFMASRIMTGRSIAIGILPALAGLGGNVVVNRGQKTQKREAGLGKRGGPELF
jgi:hypothetical protein